MSKLTDEKIEKILAKVRAALEAEESEEVEPIFYDGIVEIGALVKVLTFRGVKYALNTYVIGEEYDLTSRVHYKRLPENEHHPAGSNRG